MESTNDQTELKIVENGKLCCGFLTSKIPGIGGSIKNHAEDFIVQEIPAYQPSGSGTHTYFGLWKKNIDTQGALRQIARNIGVKASDFGTAGLKDATAITEQAASIEHLSSKQLNKLENFDNGQVRVTWISKHGNKLKPGHLIGNKFTIRIRGARENSIIDLNAKLDILKSRGAPNFYGPQRFGNRGDNWKLGLALIKEDYQFFVDTLLGGDAKGESETIQQARKLFTQGEYDESLKHFTSSYRNEKAVLSAYIRNNFNAKRAVAAADKFLKRFCVNALQSAVFNSILNERLNEIDSVRAGDLASKTSGSACFTIEEELIDRELLRAKSFEISATALMPGSKTDIAGGNPGIIESKILEKFGLVQTDFSASKHKAKGTRRPLRYPLAAASASEGIDHNGSYTELSFSAPPGAYATTLTREVIA